MGSANLYVVRIHAAILKLLHDAHEVGVELRVTKPIFAASFACPTKVIYNHSHLLFCV